MVDVAYVLGTALFFGLMLLYVRGCARLAGASASGVSVETPR